jgi:hypothetical protein
MNAKSGGYSAGPVSYSGEIDWASGDTGKVTTTLTPSGNFTLYFYK